MNYGGGSYLGIFLVKSDHSGIVQSDGTTAATAEAHALLALEDILSTDFAPQSDGSFTFSLDQFKNDAALWAFLEARAHTVNASTVTNEDLTRENGSVKKGASSDADSLLVISVGSDEEDSGDRMVNFALCNITRDSGAYKQEPGKALKPTIKFTTIEAKAALAIVAGLLPTALFTESGTVATIAEGAHKTVKFLTTT
jgi:hypothetical protein